ncbi:MAG: DUF1080 domain-containing protein [Opitutaceae bacterium]|nr:DUF1080 domain-containing protein [Opitutaceae bacterium]
MKLIPLGCLTLFVAVHAGAQAPITPDKVIPLFNGKDLSTFVTWLAPSQHRDLDKVFTVVDQIDGAPAIRISGQHWGGIATKERYTNYRLVVEFRWGAVTWEPRKNRARDSGILLHCQGPFGNFKDDFTGPWLRSVEYQIIEGGTGDIILVAGYDKKGGEKISPELTATTDGLTKVWKPNGTPMKFAGVRIDWYGRDPSWKDVLGFRGANDVEKPPGEWNRIEITCDGGSVRNVLNGVVVNEGTHLSLSEGPLLFQSEGAEIYFRRIELHPLTSSRPSAK